VKRIGIIVQQRSKGNERSPWRQVIRGRGATVFDEPRQAAMYAELLSGMSENKHLDFCTKKVACGHEAKRPPMKPRRK